VPRSHVPDLVANHVGELVLAVQSSEQATRDVDVPRRQRKGIDHVAVHHQEAILDVLARRVFGQLSPHLLDVRREILADDDSKLLLDLSGFLLAEPALGIPRHHDELRPPAHRIEGAGQRGRESGGDNGGGEGETRHGVQPSVRQHCASTAARLGVTRSSSGPGSFAIAASRAFHLLARASHRLDHLVVDGSVRRHHPLVAR
jgi:hypothetical protein